MWKREETTGQRDPRSKVRIFYFCSALNNMRNSLTDSVLTHCPTWLAYLWVKVCAGPALQFPISLCEVTALCCVLQFYQVLFTTRECQISISSKHQVQESAVMHMLCMARMPLGLHWSTVVIWRHFKNSNFQKWNTNTTKTTRRWKGGKMTYKEIRSLHQVHCLMGFLWL